MEQLQVLIVDDHPLFRKGMRALLGSTDDVVVIGEAATGAEAIEMAGALRPDLILMDLQMPEGGGLAATREITDQNERKKEIEKYRRAEEKLQV